MGALSAPLKPANRRATLPNMTNLAVGDLIIAPPRIRDSRFNKSVIMLTTQRNGASFGLCLNKPSEYTLADLAEELELDHYPNVPLYWGGPVNTSTIWMLHTSDWYIATSVEINEHWCMTSHTSMFHHLADGDCPRDFILTFGFCGWAQGQLAAELRGDPPYTIESSWLTWHQPDEHLLQIPTTDLWRVSTEQSARQAVSHWMI